MTNRQITFYVPRRIIYYGAFKQPTHKKFISSKVEISEDLKIVSIKTLMKHSRSNFEEKTECIENLVNLDAIQSFIKNDCGLCLRDTCVHLHCMLHHDHGPLVKLSKAICLRNSQQITPSSHNFHRVLNSKKNNKPTPPLFFAVFESFLQWINESSNPSLGENISVGKIIYRSTSVNNIICNEIPLVPELQITKISNSSSQYSLSSTSPPQEPNFLNPLTQDSIAFYSDDWNQAPEHEIKNDQNNVYWSKQSDPTLDVIPSNSELKEITPSIFDENLSNTSSDIDGDAEYYKTAPKIQLSGSVVESDSQYFYIFSQLEATPGVFYFGRNA